MNASVVPSFSQKHKALRKTVAKVVLHTMALSFLTLPVVSFRPIAAEAATVHQNSINPMHGPYCQSGNCTEHWNGNGKLAPQLLISGLQTGEVVRASNLSGNVDWGGNQAGAQNPSSGIDGPNNSIDAQIPKLRCVAQFVNDANQVIAPGISTLGNRGALTFRQLEQGVTVPAGATRLVGGFADSRYDDNVGHCFFTLSVQPVAAPTGGELTCVVEQVSIPRNVQAGQQVTISFGFRNTGNTTLPAGQTTLVFEPSFNGLTALPGLAPIALSQSVAPGAIATFSRTFTVPNQAGEFAVVAKAQLNGTNISPWVCGTPMTIAGGQTQQPMWHCVSGDFLPPGGGNQDVLSPGQTGTLRLVMRNTGNTTWTPGRYTFNRVPYSNGQPVPRGDVIQIPTSVAPGADMTLDIPLTAPSAPGFYHFVGKMSLDGQTFGDQVCGGGFNVNQPSLDLAACVAASGADSIQSGQQGRVQITIRNVGTTTWTQGTYRFLRVPWNGVALPGFEAVELANSVAPNQTYTFNVNFTAPHVTIPTDYVVVGQMAKNGQVIPTDQCGKPVRVVPAAPQNTQFSLTKFVVQDQSNIRPGGYITYGITFRNLTSVPTQGLTFVDNTPTGLSFHSTSDPRCTFQANALRCGPNFDFPANGDGTLYIRYNIAQNFGCDTNARNVATVTGNNFPTVDSNTVVTNVSCPVTNTNVQLTKFVEPTNSAIRVDGQVVYGITIKNLGQVPTSNLVVVDQLPAGTSFIRASDSRCTANGNNVSCPLNISNEGTLYITAKINQCGTLTNTATATASNAPNAQSNTVTTNVTCAPTNTSVSIQKQVASSSNLVAGGHITYHVPIAVGSGLDAQGVRFIDTTPAGLTFQSSPDTRCAVSGNTVVCGNGSNFNLPAGFQGTLILTFAIPSDFCSGVTSGSRAVTNNIRVEGTNFTASTASVTTNVNCPQPQGNITVTKTGPSTVSQYGSYSYNVTVTNNSQSAVNNVVVTDPLSNDLQFQSATDCYLNGSVVTCNVGTLNAGQSRSFTINVNVRSSAACNVAITNRAYATATGISQVQSQQVSTQHQCAQQGSLSVQKTGPSTVAQYGNYSYNVIVTNNSQATVSNVVVTDPLSNDLQFQSATDCYLNGTTVTCNVGTLNAGQSRSFTINVTAKSSAACNAAITNTAFATATGVAQVQSSQVTTTVQCNQQGQNFTINITDSPDPVRPDQSLNYTLQVTNNTNSQQTVDIRQILPPRVDFQFASDNGSHSNGVINWYSQTFSANQTRNYNVTVRTRSDLNDGDILYTTAYAGNAQDSENTRVIDDEDNKGDDDLDISITDNPDPVRPCEELTYRIRVRNNGNSSRTVNLIAELDQDTEFEDASDNGDERSNDEVEWRNFHIDRNDEEEVELTVNVDCDADDTLNLRARAAEASDTERTDVEERNNNPGPGGNLSFQKQASLTTAQPGDTVTYTLTIRNNTNTTVTNVVVNDTFNTSQLSMQSIGTGIQNGSQITWNLGTLNAGESRILTYTAQISGSLRHGDIVVNNAVMTSNQGTLTAYANISIIQHLPQTGSAFTDDIDDGTGFITRRSSSRGSAAPIAAAASIALTGLSAVGYVGRRFFF